MTRLSSPDPSLFAHHLLLEAIAKSLGGPRSPEGQADPAAVLWTDTDGQWRPLLPRLREVLPHVFTLGSYDPATRTGPAIWLKCVVARAIPEAPPAGTIPILYLPGVSRQQLRAGGDCPEALQPLVELQYRGRVWHQSNGRDWSVEAFLVAGDGAGLEIAQDARTREAMLQSLALLADAPLEPLRGRRLDADDFHGLAVTDRVRDLLRWMNSPELFRAQLDASRWAAFCELSRSRFDIDPERDAPTEAGRALIEGRDRWDEVWERFCEAPALYRGLADLLRDRQSQPATLTFDSTRRPLVNDDAEEELRKGLEQAAARTHRDACDAVLALETEHGRRRAWVWARIGEAPLASALEPLGRLATLARSALGGGSIESMARAYADEGWRCDRAAVQALAQVRHADALLVGRVVRAVYCPWLDESARHFQTLAAGSDLRALVATVVPEADTCLLFVDGLRFDVGAHLQEQLEARSLRVALRYRFAALPGVTSTAKPAVTPVTDFVRGADVPGGFEPLMVPGGQPATASRLRDAMAAREFDVMEGADLRVPSRADAKGWSEVGQIDKLGHALQSELPRHIDDEVGRIADRVMALLDCGWSRVRVVTDHGWLLMPGGLPKVDLPASVVSTKWSRCAVVKGASTPDVPTYAWFWNASVRLASPPGVGSYRAGDEYSHGGLSLQECVLPELVVQRGVDTVRVAILSVVWRGMRCRVTVEMPSRGADGLRVDIRRHWKQPDTSLVASAREIGATGEANVVVTNDQDEGASAVVVVLDESGNVVAREGTTVGEV